MAQRLFAQPATHAVYSPPTFPTYGSVALTNVNLVYIAFPGNVDTSVFYQSHIPVTYSGSDVTFRLFWRVAGASGLTVKWQARISTNPADAVGYNNMDFGPYTAVIANELDAGDLQITNIVLPVATYLIEPDEVVQVQLRRNALDAQDTSPAGAQLLFVELREG